MGTGRRGARGRRHHSLRYRLRPRPRTTEHVGLRLAFRQCLKVVRIVLAASVGELLTLFRLAVEIEPRQGRAARARVGGEVAKLGGAIGSKSGRRGWRRAPRGCKAGRSVRWNHEALVRPTNARHSDHSGRQGARGVRVARPVDREPEAVPCVGDLVRAGGLRGVAFANDSECGGCQGKEGEKWDEEEHLGSDGAKGRGWRAGRAQFRLNEAKFDRLFFSERKDSWLSHVLLAD